MDVSTKIAYLKGLGDGLEISEETKEGKAIAKIVDVLEDMQEAIEELYDMQEDLNELVEAIDEDLSDVEELLTDGCDCDCDCDDEERYCGLETDDYIEVECPECGETVCFFNDVFEDDETVEILCPNCDAVVYTIDNAMLNEEYCEEENDN